jgi:hypothetical protein
MGMGMGGLTFEGDQGMRECVSQDLTRAFSSLLVVGFSNGPSFLQYLHSLALN